VRRTCATVLWRTACRDVGLRPLFAFCYRSLPRPLQTLKIVCDAASMTLTRRSVIGGIAAVGLFGARGSQAQQMNPDLSHLTPKQRAEYEAMHARMMAAFKYERITVPGAAALIEWEKLKGAGRGWPVIVGDDEDLEQIAGQFTIADHAVSGATIPGLSLRSPDEILTAATTLRFPTDLQTWSGAYKPEDLTAPIGSWPSRVDNDPPGPTIATDILSGKFHDRVHIILIPTRSSWEVPAYLRWGDWNACPPPEYHVAALRTWHEQFGVELVGLNGDTMNLRAGRRPITRQRATALAKDQYAYCPDIVDQGVGTVSALAATLMSSEWWYLWWD